MHPTLHGVTYRLSADGNPWATTVTSFNNCDSNPVTGTTADVTGDGYAEAVVRTADSDILYYANNIVRDGVPYSGSGLPTGGGGWGVFRSIIGADVSGDGYADLLGVRSDGKVFYYPNNIRRDGEPFGGSGVEVASGFAGFAHVTAADVTGDGYADLIAVKNDTLLLYPNNIERDGIPFANSTPVGQNGWSTFTALL